LLRAMTQIRFMPMAKRNILTLDIQPEGHKVLDDECDRTGMSKREMVKRLLEWFAGQDEVIRGSILGTLPPSVAVPVAKLDPSRLKGKR
jgi:hypothetical protein